MSSARVQAPQQQSQIVIRQFQSDDRAAVGALFVDGFPLVSPGESQLLHTYITSCLESDLADVLGAYITPGGNFWVATTIDSHEKGKSVVVGMVALKKQVNGEGELCRMSVKKEFRRYGIGKLLVKELEHWAKENAFKSISLWTGEEMTVAQQFYRSIGYEKRSKRAIPEDPNVTVFEHPTGEHSAAPRSFCASSATRTARPRHHATTIFIDGFQPYPANEGRELYIKHSREMDLTDVLGAYVAPGSPLRLPTLKTTKDIRWWAQWAREVDKWWRRAASHQARALAKEEVRCKTISLRRIDRQKRAIV